MAEQPPPITITHRYSIIDAKNETVAHVEVCDTAGVLWVSNLWVGPEHRRKGYATALLARAVIEWSHQELYLQVAPYTDQPLDSAQLAAFYGSFGFAPTTVPGVLHRPPRPWVGRAPKTGAATAEAWGVRNGVEEIAGILNTSEAADAAA